MNMNMSCPNGLPFTTRQLRLPDVDDVVLKLREQQWTREDEANGEPSDGVQSERESLRLRLRQRMRAAYFDRQRVLVCCATPSEARKVGTSRSGSMRTPEGPETIVVSPV